MKRAELEVMARAIIDPMADQVKKLLAKRDERIAELESTLAKAHETIESLERRASRHADHLGRLETRLKALETK